MIDSTHCSLNGAFYDTEDNNNDSDGENLGDNAERLKSGLAGHDASSSSCAKDDAACGSDDADEVLDDALDFVIEIKHNEASIVSIIS
ncbi:hypothetical protein DL764_003340 [Monosporascus ibericus]|uniref:Uncharacterized protein n=1 Tax=Monosporascus ibericus TaxID=155417 RepID=A0A4Q4THK9_9PEZI|nr:hypothetical protein DL764_003340 [Monosporascus ibericus]